LRPSGANTTPATTHKVEADRPHCCAAALISRARAAAAISGIAAAKDRMVEDPPVIWLKTSSGRASADVTSTELIATSISSATIIPTAVAMPVPVSRRGRSRRTLPFVPTVKVTSGIVGSEVCTIESPMS
jgi:hypothetical protein